MSSTPSPSPWQYVAFPLVSAWRDDFWSLPVYFPDLWLGDMTGRPAGLPLGSLPLPPRQEGLADPSRDFRPGELSQWQAYLKYSQRPEEEQGDIVRSLKGQPPRPRTAGPDPAAFWTLDWRLEKSLAEATADLGQVAARQTSLDDILAPEAWEEDSRRQAAAWQDPALAPVDRLDPELLKLRLQFWLKVAEPHLTPPWVPVCLDRGVCRHLSGWLEQQAAAGEGVWWTAVSLPLVRSAAVLEARRPPGAPAGGANGFSPAWAALLTAVSGGPPGVTEARRRLEDLVSREGQPAAGAEPYAPLRVIVCRAAADPQSADFLPAGFDAPLLLWLPGE